VRLFAAVDPSSDVVAALSAAVSPVASASDSPVRWSPPEQWHVTVAFYGTVSGAATTELVERLSRAAGRGTAMSLSIDGFGGFPSPSRARVVVATLGGDVALLTRLAQRCVAAGRRTGIEMQRRRFRPHLTIGRARGEPVDVSSLLAAPGEVSWEADALRLVASRLGPVVQHETVASWPLYQA
jgi:2'-5' RNA ligase